VTTKIISWQMLTFDRCHIKKQKDCSHAR